MNELLRHKLSNIISGYKINEDDDEWLRALLYERSSGYKEGMLAAIEISSNYTSVYDVANDFLGSVTEVIRAKAEGL